MLGNYVESAADLRKGQKYDFDPDTQSLLKEVDQYASRIEQKVNAARIANEEKEREGKLAARKKAAADRRRQQQEEEERASAQHGHGHGGGHGHSHGGQPCDGNHRAPEMPSGGGMPGGMDMGAMMGLMQDPEVMKLIQKPNVMAAFVTLSYT